MSYYDAKWHTARAKEAMHKLSIWYKTWVLWNNTGMERYALKYKAHGIVAHDRWLVSLSGKGKLY